MVANSPTTSPRITACLRARLAVCRSPAPTERAISAVPPVEMAVNSVMAMNTHCVVKLTAASSAVPM